jgi:hypothetical protein
VLTAIIEQGDREIDAYLSPHGIGADATVCKSASLELAKAGLLDRARQDGTRADTLQAGDTTESLKIEDAIKRHRQTAFGLLDLYISKNVSPASTGGLRVYKVNR